MLGEGQWKMGHRDRGGRMRPGAQGGLDKSSKSAECTYGTASLTFHGCVCVHLNYCE